MPANREILLPDAPAEIVGGGDGKYLLLTFPTQRKLAVFEVAAAADPRYLDVGTSNFLAAAGRTRFVVIDSEKRTISRYRLDTGALEKTVPFVAGPEGIGAATMGADSEGPLILWDLAKDPAHDTSLRFLDLETLEFGKVNIEDWNRMWSLEDARIRRIAASADGTKFCVIKSETPANQSFLAQMFALVGDRAFAYGERVPAGEEKARLSYDGSTIDRETERIRPNRDTFTPESRSGDDARIGGACFSPFVWFSVRPKYRNDPVRVDFHFADTEWIIATFDDLGGLDGVEYAKLGADCYCSPREKTLVAVRDKPHRLLVRGIDLGTALKNPEVHFVRFAGTPPAFYLPGTKFTYQANVVATAPGLKIRLELGPKGMTLSDTGLVEWDAPADASDEPVVVRISADAPQPGFENQYDSSTLIFKMKPVRFAAPLAADAGPVDRDAPLVTVPLPGKIDRVAVGAGGKYLLAAIGSKRQVAVVDVRERKVVKSLPMDDDMLRIAAGAKKFAVYCGGSQQLHRYDFATMERDLSAAVDFGPPAEGPADIAAGAASEGPIVLIHPTKGMRLTSMQTLQPLVLVEKKAPALLELKGDHIVASADGRGFVFWEASTDTYNPEAEVVFFNGGRMQRYESVKDAKAHLLSANGLTMFASFARRDLKGERLPIDPDRGSPTCVPSVTGDYYVTLSEPLTLYAGGVTRPLATLENASSPELPKQVGTDPLRAMRMLFAPEAEAIIAIPPSDDRLIVYRVNIDELLKKADHDYLFAASLPPSSVMSGETYRHQVEVRSRRDGVTFRLETAPAGMEISPTGLITWKAPIGIDRSDPVVVRFKDSAGNEAGQTFEIRSVVGAPSEARPRVPIELAGTFNRALVGGGGRYIVVYFHATKRIGVVDLVERKVVGHVTVEEEPRIVAGREKFVVCLPTKKRFVRYDLASAGEEQSTEYAELGKFVTMAMGPDSAGPILLAHEVSLSRFEGGRQHKLEFIDLETLRPKPLRLIDPHANLSLFESAWRPTADGRLFSHVFRHQLIRLAGDAAIVEHPPADMRGGKFPDAEGEVLFGYAQSITSDGALLELRETPKAYDVRSLYPAMRGPLIAGYHVISARSNPTGHAPLMQVFARGDGRPQLDLADVDLPTSDGDTWSTPECYDARPPLRERLFFVPHLKLIATVPESFDRVIVHEFDFDAEVKRRADDYMFVFATAPDPIEPGKPWSYQLDVRSKQGGLTYRIDKGPAGAAVSPTGLITWTPPADAAAVTSLVAVVCNGAGHELSHTVRIKKPIVAPPPPEYRKWTGSDGKFSVMAAFVELRGELVVLTTAEGRTVAVPIGRLSTADQSHAREATKKP